MEQTKTIAEIKQLLENTPLDNHEIEAFRMDKRKGVKKLVAQHERKMVEKQRLRAMYKDMMHFEQLSAERGKTHVAGLDEAGRGPLAGPVVAGAVILSDHFYLEGINDSKQLSLHKREKYFDYINREAAVGIGIVSSEEIDQYNIYNATKLAMRRAVNQLNISPDHLLIDAMHVENMPCSQQSIIKGDQRSVSVAAASIIAKVTRDRLMKDLDGEYPQYDFQSNQGYGTKKHLQALKNYGPIPQHRKTFSPVKEYIYS
ncbi:ribonuclease HII [Halobacillus seohaensis]|uniref:Ribonuclease HII n=1 Tax=Halobacillus seohaensis TaxID=447421 RepID=A0ABW2EGD8_9BACI